MELSKPPAQVPPQVQHRVCAKAVGAQTLGGRGQQRGQFRETLGVGQAGVRSEAVGFKVLRVSGACYHTHILLMGSVRTTRFFLSPPPSQPCPDCPSLLVLIPPALLFSPKGFGRSATV